MSAVIQNKAERDPRVEDAISHWAPRFVANGVPLADCQEVTASVSRWEDWCAAWSARAAVHEEMGNKALAGGYNTSAAAHFTRGAVCYHFGKFLFVNDMAQMKEAHRRAVECRNKALPHLDPPGERVAIPYEGRQLYGNLRKPTAPRAAAFERRIRACVALSGPFQRSADFTGRPQMNVEAFRVRSKSANLEEAGKVAVRFSLAECAKNISCPIYIVAGTKDRLTPHTEGEKLAASVSGPCVLSVIEGGNHVVNNLWYRYGDQTADWMAAQLGAPKR